MKKEEYWKFSIYDLAVLMLDSALIHGMRERAMFIGGVMR